MRPSYSSTNNSQFQSITSKSSNSSIISILREPSPNRQKKQNSVRFEDSPTVSVYSDTSKFSNTNSLSPNSPGSKSSSPGPYKPLTPSPVKLTPGKKSGILLPKKNSPIKITLSPEPKPESVERKVTPTVISYSFRTQGFYDKLNRYYSGEPGSTKAQPERIYIKLNTSMMSENEKKSEEKPVINLRPCSSNAHHPRERIKSPVKDCKSFKRLRGSGQNILN